MSTLIAEPATDVRTAVKAALSFFSESFRLVHPENVQLEEIELSDDERHWLITVGYDDPAHASRPTLKFQLPGQRVPRKYKVVRVDASTGRALSVKIRPNV